MAKANSIKIKLVSTADTGFYYVTKKNARTQTEKLSYKKYDPVGSQDQVRPASELRNTKTPALPKCGGFRFGVPKRFEPTYLRRKPL